MLIKGKRISAKEAEDEEEEEEEDEDGDEAGPNSTSAKPKHSDKEKTGESEKEGGDGKSSKKKKGNHKTHPDLSAITYLGTGKVKAFTPEVSSSIPADMMASYGEGKTYKLAKNPDKVEGWIEHNKAHLRYDNVFLKSRCPRLMFSTRGILIVFVLGVR